MLIINWALNRVRPPLVETNLILTLIPCQLFRLYGYMNDERYMLPDGISSMGVCTCTSTSYTKYVISLL